MNKFFESLLSKKLLAAIATVLGIDLGGVSTESVYVVLAYIIGQSLVDFAKAWRGNV
jgi:hypothetical protein